MLITIQLNDQELTYLNTFMALTLKSEHGLQAVASVHLFQQKILLAVEEFNKNERKEELKE